MKKSAIVICALISMWTAGPVMASAGAPPAKATALAQQAVIATETNIQQVAEATSYAEREKAAPELASFTGGNNGVYIGGSTLAIVLLIVLLVVLL